MLQMTLRVGRSSAYIGAVEVWYHCFFFFVKYCLKPIPRCCNLGLKLTAPSPVSQLQHAQVKINRAFQSLGCGKPNFPPLALIPPLLSMVQLTPPQLLQQNHNKTWSSVRRILRWSAQRLLFSRSTHALLTWYYAI